MTTEHVQDGPDVMLWAALVTRPDRKGPPSPT